MDRLCCQTIAAPKSSKACGDIASLPLRKSKVYFPWVDWMRPFCLGLALIPIPILQLSNEDLPLLENPVCPCLLGSVSLCSVPTEASAGTCASGWERDATDNNLFLAPFLALTPCPQPQRQAKCLFFHREGYPRAQEERECAILAPFSFGRLIPFHHFANPCSSSPPPIPLQPMGARGPLLSTPLHTSHWSLHAAVISLMEGDHICRCRNEGKS